MIKEYYLNLKFKIFPKLAVARTAALVSSIYLSTKYLCICLLPNTKYTAAPHHYSAIIITNISVIFSLKIY